VPLDVQFAGSESHDPEGQALTYTWDFGDGSPVEHVADTSHTYVADGPYVAMLTVGDPGGQSSSAALNVVAGAVPLALKLLNPAQGTTLHLPATLTMQAEAQPAEVASWSWTVDLYHDNHVHPAALTST